MLRIRNAVGSRCARVSSTALVLPLLWAGLGCDGSISDPSPLGDDSGPSGSDAGVVAGDGGTVSDAGTTPVDMGLPSFNPFSTGGVTIGTLCGADGAETHMVFTENTPSCATHAQLLSGGTTSDDIATVILPGVTGPTQLQATAHICIEGSCSDRPATIEIDAYGPTGAIGRWTIPLGDRIATGNLQAAVCAYDQYLDGPDPTLAPNLAIDQIAIYQGVKVSLVESQQVVSRETPVIAGRDALVRAFVAPEAGFLSGTYTGELTIRDENGAETVLTDSRTISVASSENDPSSTFNFDIEGSQLETATELSLTLRSSEACAGSTGSTLNARYPTDGTFALGAVETGTFKVVLVPMLYAADGSNRAPDTSATQLQRYRDKLLALYPVSDVDLQVREPVTYTEVIQPNGYGWSQVLLELQSIRAEDDPGFDVHYYGIFAPASSIIRFCSGGCVAGLGNLPSPNDASRRAAVGLGFTGEGSTNTAAHELGHTNGRYHAPCGVSDADPNYPTDSAHSEASIGVWGYDIVDKSTKSPSLYKDVMSYCEPEWVSDYTFEALQTRLSYVNGVSSKYVGDATPWRWMTLSPELDSHWGRTVTMATPPSGAAVPVRFFDAGRQLLETSVGYSGELDHLPDELLAVPAPPEGAVYLQVADRALIPIPDDR